METEYNVSDETIQFYTKLFFINFQTEGRDQLTNMVSGAIAFSECFDDLTTERDKLKDILEKPIQFIQKKYKKKFSQKVLQRWDERFSLSDLEWISYRDTKFRSALKLEYYSDSTRPNRKYLTLKDVVTLRGYIKVEVANIFSAMVKLKRVSMRPDLLDIADAKPLKAVGEQ